MAKMVSSSSPRTTLGRIKTVYATSTGAAGANFPRRACECLRAGTGGKSEIGGAGGSGGALASGFTSAFEGVDEVATDTSVYVAGLFVWMKNASATAAATTPAE